MRMPAILERPKDREGFKTSLGHLGASLSYIRPLKKQTKKKERVRQGRRRGGKGLKGNCSVAFSDQGLSAKEAPKRLHSLGTRVQCRQCKPFLFVNQ